MSAVNATHERQAISLFQRDIVRRALIDSLVKLDPRVQIRNPVMFVVEIGSVITTVTWLIQAFGGKPLGGGHTLKGTGDPARDAAAPRPTRCATCARRPSPRCGTAR